jgi:hypothetical protein
MIDRKFGKERRDQHRRDVALFWEYLSTIINAVVAHLDGTAIRIYPDGILVGGKRGAHNGISNHQIVLSIIEHGGVLEKTESLVLLNEENEITKAVVNAKTDPEREAFSEKQKHSLYELTIERRGGISLNIKQQQKP